MPSLFTLHSREHRYLFSYLLLATLLLAGMAGWVLYRHYDLPSAEERFMSSRIKNQQQLFNQQKQYIPILDSAHHAVATYRPEVTAVFLEAEIENWISEIRHVYTANDTVDSFRSFDQAANFYRMIYHDKKILASKKANTRDFKEQYDKCSVGAQSQAPKGTSSPTIVPPTPLPLSR